jgi:hypothetical protein
LKGKKTHHRIISVYSEKHQENSTPLHGNTLNKLGIEKICLTIIKAKFDKPTVNIVLKEES